MKNLLKRHFSTSQSLSYANTSDYKLNNNFKTDSWKISYASDIESTLKDIFSRYIQEGVLHTLELFSERTTATGVERLNINILDNNIGIYDSNVNISPANALDVYVDLLASIIHQHVSLLKDHLNEPIKVDIILFVTHNSTEDI